MNVDVATIMFVGMVFVFNEVPVFIVFSFVCVNRATMSSVAGLLSSSIVNLCLVEEKLDEFVHLDRLLNPGSCGCGVVKREDGA